MLGFLNKTLLTNKISKFLLFSASFLLLASILTLTSRAYYLRLGAFGCFDQCFNFVAGYFMLKGKALYSQIFFNHQPLMAYLSYFVQTIFKPTTLYHLVLFHRLFILFFSLMADVFLIFRFRWPALGFVLFYEATKFYLFGNSFLPEALIIYPLVFLLGLVWEKLKETQLSDFDYLLAGIATWLVVFLALPYLPVALLLLGLIYFLNKPTKKAKAILLLSFFLPSLFILTLVPLKDYLFDLFVVNRQMVINEARATGMVGLGIIKVFFYPLHILTKGEMNFFRTILIPLDIILLISAGLIAVKFRKLKIILFLFTILACSLSRFVPPGKVFYESFHLLPWYALFLFSIFLLLKEIFLLYWSSNKAFPVAFLITIIIIFAYLTNSPSWFVWEKIDPHEEFYTNYTHYYVYGNAIKLLAKPNDTLFLDLWDDLIYWQAGLDSPYQYSLYTPVMTKSPRFQEARLRMFQENPPDFYYHFCDKETILSSLLPEENKEDYLQIFSNSYPTCFYIKKSKLDTISQQQWESVRELGFHNKSTPEKKNVKIEIIKP